MPKEPGFDIKMLTDLSLLRQTSARDLEKLVHKYPYFQTGYNLLAKHYHENKSDKFDDFLKKTAIRSVDRGQLYDIINNWEISASSEEVNETKIQIAEEKVEKVPESIESEVSTEFTTKEFSIEEQIESLPKDFEFELPKDFDSELLDKTISELIDKQEEALNIPQPSTTSENIHEDPSEFKEEVQEINTEKIVVDIETKKSQVNISFLTWISNFESVPVSTSKPKKIETQKVELNEQIREKSDLNPERPSINKDPKEESNLEENSMMNEIGFMFDLPQRAPLKTFVKKSENIDELNSLLEGSTPTYQIEEIPETPNKTIQEIENQREIIDRFIDKNIDSTPAGPKEKIEDKKTSDLSLSNPISEKTGGVRVSETLAIIHTKQGNLEKAIEIYKRLILQDPKKSTYFVSQIEKLKKLQ